MYVGQVRASGTGQRTRREGEAGGETVHFAVAEGAPGNRRVLIVALVPLALAVLFCLSTVFARAARPRLETQAFGQTTRAQASRIADGLLSQVTGGEARTVDVSTQSAYAFRRGEMVREWDVVAETRAGDYLLRINADNGLVYAVNRMSRPEAEDSAATALSSRQNLSREQAEQRAKGYLALLGVEARGLERMDDSALFAPDPGHPAGKRLRARASQIEVYNFTYRRHVPGIGARLLKVSVNGQTGALEHLWNPASAL
jgi:hypothetical protein